MAEKSLDVNNYVLDDNYESEVVVYDEEIDGDAFPDRDDHLKKKEEEQKRVKALKDKIAKNRVRL